MSIKISDRALKKAYFTDIYGGNIIDFQFTPESLEFEEGGKFKDRVAVGRYQTDYVWISGKPNTFDLKMWVDRTDESISRTDFYDPFADEKRFPKQTRSRYLNFDIVNLTKDKYNGIKSMFYKKDNIQSNDIDPSIYSFNPEFPQDSIQNNSKGVYYDLERLMFFVRPQGFKLSSGTLETDGTLKISDVKQSRFTPPPKVRFFYGNMWCEGYISEVKYTLSAMNRNLVPRRLEAEIQFLRINWGYLEEVEVNNEVKTI